MGVRQPTDQQRLSQILQAHDTSRRHTINGPLSAHTHITTARASYILSIVLLVTSYVCQRLPACHSSRINDHAAAPLEWQRGAGISATHSCAGNGGRRGSSSHLSRHRL
eukprot:scaffold78268_cov54-Phaeocystis_antarctica.AAC.3